MDRRPEPGRIDPDGRASPSRSRLAGWLLVGVAVGLTVGLVAAVPLIGQTPPLAGPLWTFDGLGTGVTDWTTAPLPPPALPASTSTTWPPLRLDEMLPGFEGFLYISGYGPGGGMTYLRWFHALVVPTPLLPGEELTKFFVHPSGERVAALSQLTGDRFMLWTGTPGGLVEFAIDRFANLTWHSTDQKRLAWITFGSPPRLKEVQLSSGAETVEIEAELGRRGYVHLFDDRGFLVESYGEGSGLLLALDPDGQQVGSVEGYFVGMLGERIVVDAEEGIFTVDRLLGDRQSWELLGDVRHVSSAPEGEAFVTVGQMSVTLWLSEDPAVTLVGNFGLPAWSEDGRWVAMPIRPAAASLPHLIQVIDVATLEAYQFEIPVPLDSIDQIWFGP